MTIQARRITAAGLALLTCTCAPAAAQEAASGSTTTLVAATKARGPLGEVADVASTAGDRTASSQRDSSLDGLLIGAAVGAIPGIYYLITDPNECTGMCPEEYGLIAAGAAIGWLVDRAITRKGSRAGERASVSLVPYAARSRKGVRVAIRF
jgi:hypothetical protein